MFRTIQIKRKLLYGSAKVVRFQTLNNEHQTENQKTPNENIWEALQLLLFKEIPSSWRYEAQYGRNADELYLEINVEKHLLIEMEIECAMIQSSA